MEKGQIWHIQRKLETPEEDITGSATKTDSSPVPKPHILRCGKQLREDLHSESLKKMKNRVKVNFKLLNDKVLSRVTLG